MLFVDQATRISGWAYFSEPYVLKAYNIIDLSPMPKLSDEDQANKRYELLKQLNEIILKYKIKLLTTEGVYFHSDPETHKKLAQMQGCIQDFCRNNNNNIVCFSWKCAGEWRKWLGIKSKKREEYKEETKKYVLEYYDVREDIESKIFDKYHNPEKHKSFDDLSKEIKNIQFDFYDSIAQGDAYFRMIENLGEACE
jgi:Holliday junction resolvasome RuvABC endonuclease subunit